MESMDIHAILEYLPHRYPFLLVDRVLDMELDKRIHAIKNVTINEPFFPGHFDYHPVMPGVLILEALAQAAAILCFKSRNAKPDGKTVYYFVGIDNARFKKPVMPGDQLNLHIEITRYSRGLWKFKAEAKVDGQVVTEADLMCAIRMSEVGA
ncbi:MAG TPA: 3-hydroxyacyl-ACP dehydratase FabZ [Burkholderiales bacterium]